MNKKLQVDISTKKKNTARERCRVMRADVLDGDKEPKEVLFEM